MKEKLEATYNEIIDMFDDDIGAITLHVGVVILDDGRKLNVCVCAEELDESVIKMKGKIYTQDEVDQVKIEWYKKGQKRGYDLGFGNGYEDGHKQGADEMAIAMN